MEQESEKYKKVLEILRNSKPVLNSTDDIENEVIKRISKVKKQGLNLLNIIDFLFGWVYIGWVRNGLITASVLLVMFFIWQQSIILNRIDLLSRQTIIENGETISNSASEVERGIMMYKLSGRRLPSHNIIISDRQMKQLLDSVYDLQTKYKDLIKLIEDDPELKSSIEKKLKEHNQQKTKI
jgi:hypothetical protein